MSVPSDVKAEPPANVPAATAVIAKRRGKGRRHASSAAEMDEASRLMISDIVKQLHRQARVLRGLGYAFLILIATVLGAGAYFYWHAQSFVLDQLNERSDQVIGKRESVKTKETEINALEKEIVKQNDLIGKAQWPISEISYRPNLRGGAVRRGWPPRVDRRRGRYDPNHDATRHYRSELRNCESTYFDQFFEI
jgi:hypothetical protein